MNKCKHCNQETSLNSIFCCSGCKIAYKVIKSFKLNEYYKFCKEIYGVNPMKVNITETELDYEQDIRQLEDGTKSINLLVEGIHCGSCIWLIESTLRKDPLIEKANINLSTKRLVIQWKGNNDIIYRNIKQIFALGYRLIPFTPELVEQENSYQERDLLLRMAVAGFGTVAMMMTIWGVWAGNFDHSMGYYTRFVTHILAALVVIPAILYSGLPFFISAYKAVKSYRTNMDVPISIGVLGATFISIQQMIQGSAYTYFDAAISLIFFLLIGRYLELKSRNHARSIAHNLILSQSKVITLYINGKLILVPLSKAKNGDIAFASAGDKIAADGVLIEGISDIDNQIITGESLPTPVKVGDKVISGTINITNPIKYRIMALGESTVLGEIIRLMEIAEQGRSNYVHLADRIAKYFTPIVILLSLITFGLWFFIWSADLNTAIINAVALLIITCPCALGLAVPIVQIIASSKLMSGGIILKAENALEKLNDVNYVVFDKTGTLTLGQPQLTNRWQIKDEDYLVISNLAAHSKHVLCKNISTGDTASISFDGPVKEVKGMGITALINKKKVVLGSRKLCKVKDDNNDNLMELWFRYDSNVPIRLTFADQLRSDAKEVINRLKLKNLEIEILSGDRPSVVKEIACELGIDLFNGHQNPIQKYERLNYLANLGKKVLMVGDGLNDAAALKAAYLSISPSTSLEVTQVNSDIIFQGEKLNPVNECHDVAKFSTKIIKQNLTFSLIYNLISLPLAMLGYVNPIIAAITMSTSSIIVVINSLRIKKNPFF